MNPYRFQGPRTCYRFILYTFLLFFRYVHLWNYYPLLICLYSYMSGVCIFSFLFVATYTVKINLKKINTIKRGLYKEWIYKLTQILYFLWRRNSLKLNIHGHQQCLSMPDNFSTYTLSNMLIKSCGTCLYQLQLSYFYCKYNLNKSYEN